MSSLLERRTRPAEAEAPAPARDDRLVTWLRLLGWDVRLGRRGHVHLAVARRVIGSSEVEVVARGDSRTAAVVKLFEAAVETASATT